ncbi:hypothetical protein GLE_2418 [Lysobacter enzymogenes]|uniref:Uncharacterized protein n=1 Tax=Lysobacter enzymogenes TaxID=69 RepID=A0A0S2DGL0_LYSEN|nr:hypothetical protein GLE_2418 [Lysobacter enzymogenes]
MPPCRSGASRDRGATVRGETVDVLRMRQPPACISPAPATTASRLAPLLHGASR